jgi:hypothetical protein
MPLEGGEESQVLSDAGGYEWPNWAITPNGIYFLRFEKFPRATIAFFEFATGKTTSLWALDKEPGWGVSVSPEGKSLIYVQDEFAESNIMLVKNFR